MPCGEGAKRRKKHINHDVENKQTYDIVRVGKRLHVGVRMEWKKVKWPVVRPLGLYGMRSMLVHSPRLLLGRLQQPAPSAEPADQAWRLPVLV